MQKSQITINVLRHGCCSLPKSCPTLQPHRLQHARPICPPPFSWSLFKFMSIESMMLSNHLKVRHNWVTELNWTDWTISSSAAPFSFCLQSFQASGSFPLSQFFSSGSESIGASASALVLPVSIHGWFSLALTDWVCLLSKGLSKVFSSTTIWKHQLFSVQPSLWSSSYLCTWLLEKP